MDLEPSGQSANGRTSVWAWTVLAMLLAAMDLSLHLFQTWVSLDEGAMGLAATLVRHGAWPHADFTDPYSGGLAVLDAGAQFLFGDDLRALRIPFGIAAILWVPLLAACFRRFCSAPAAAGLALVAFLWGPPLYTAAMPSWYLLFIATGLVWCLFRWHETRDPRWWGAVGALIGAGLLLKINALFLLAGAGCVLLTDTELDSGPLGALIVLLGLAGACYTVSLGWPLVESGLLLLPLIALAAVTTRATLRRAPAAQVNFGRVLVPGGWLAAGLAIVVVPWLLAYAIHGGLGDLARGMFVLPFRRAQFARMLPRLPRVSDLLILGVVVALLLSRRAARFAIPIACGVVGFALILSDAARMSPSPIVPVVWRDVRALSAIMLLLGAGVWARAPGRSTQPILIATWIAAWFALLQYPFAAPNYLAYVAPLLLLAAAAAASVLVARPIGIAVVAFLAIWSVGVDHGQSLGVLGLAHTSPPEVSRLMLPRGGIEIPTPEARGLESLVALLDRWHARTIVAGPDAPDIYYLSGRPLQDREFFEFMAPEWSAATLAGRIITHRPDVAVLNREAFFSPVSIDSVVALLPERPVTDTLIGPFRVLRFARPDASP